MNWPGKSVLWALSFTVLLSLAGCGEEPEETLDLSALELNRLDGTNEPLSNWRGKIVILNIWATWCGPCRKEMPELQQLSQELDPNRVVVLGLSVDKNPALVKEFLRQNGIDFANHIDRDKSVSRDILGVTVLPQTLIIDSTGLLKKRVVGYQTWVKDELVLSFSKMGMPGF